MPISHVVFDVDGTIMDTESRLVRVLDEILRERAGMSLAREEIARACIGNTESGAMRELEVPEALRDGIIETWRETVREDASRNPTVYDGMIDLFEALRDRGCKLGIVTTRDLAFFDFDLSPAGVLPYFGLCVTSDRTDEYKPSPKPLLYYLEHAGIGPDEAVYIGDTDADKRCAEGAGVAFALARWGERIGTGPEVDHVLRNPMDTLRLLEEIE